MGNYELNADELVLYEGGVSANIAKGRLQLRDSVFRGCN